MLHLCLILALQTMPAPASSPASAGAIPTPVPTTLPYPAYGAPAPGAASKAPVAGVPAQITLSQAIAIAAAKSPILAAARANRRLSEIPVELAHTALFPNISGAASLTQNNFYGAVRNGGTGGSGGTGGTPQSNASVSKGVSATLRQLIYDGGRVIAQIHQARANAVAGADTYERALETLAFNVSQAYYTVLQAQTTTQVDAQVVNQNVVQENLVRAQLRAGTASRVDLATVSLPTAQARVALVRQQGVELSAEAAFAQALGLDPNALVSPQYVPADTQPTTAVKVLSYDEAVTRALALRPDYHAAQETVLASQYNLQFQRSGLLPSLSGSASYGTSSTNSAGNAYAPSSSLNLTLSIPVFDQGLTRANTETASAQLDLARANLASTKLTVETDIRTALIGVVTAQAAVAQAQAEYSEASTILSATRAQYRAGVTTLPLLLNAQVGLTTASTDLVNAVYSLRQAEQTYIFDLGESDLIPGL